MKEVSISSELEHRQEDELNSIESIYGDIFKNITSKELIWNKKPNPHFQIHLVSDEVCRNPEVSIILDIEFTPTYPLSSPKVKLLQPHNLLKIHVSKLKSKVDELLKEYKNEEVAFTIISELKFILDEIQATTEKVLSLEEEREQRLRNERIALEEKEAKQQRDKELSTKKRGKELNEQIQKLKDELVEESDDEDESADIVPLPVDHQNYFIFDNEMEDILPNSRIKFKFRAVSGFIKYTKRGIFNSIGKQMIVKPFVTREIQQKADKQGLELTYLLTEIVLDNSYWQKDGGKHEIQDLEKELQNCLKLRDPHILKLIGFQIDKNDGWKVRLLNEFSFVAESINEIMPAKGHISLPLARKWLMDLIPVIEQLHNSGVIHKSINSFTAVIFDDENVLNSSYSESSLLNDTKIIKLCHPSYGYKLNNMIETHPNGGTTKFLKDKNQVPESWIAPELKASGDYNPKTDVWDLGVLFLKVIMGKDTLNKDFPTPEEFNKKFVEKMKLQSEEYAESVYDLLNKLLQLKFSKRPTLMELNAVKFLRDGPILKQTTTHMHNNDQKSLRSPTTKTRRKFSNELKNPDIIRNLNSSMVSSEKQRNSRYERDFEEIGRLGKGGFGDVVKARNRMEGTYYAVKKIKHRANKLDYILSEVLSLARLNHQYIVRYYSTWVEEDEEENNNEDETESSIVPTNEEAIQEDESDMSSLNHTNQSSSYLPTHNSSFQIDYMSRSFDPRVEFDDESFGNKFEDDEEDEDGFVFANSTDLDNTKEESASTTASESNNAIFKPTVPPKVEQKFYPKSILYIQMEFCENNTLLNLIEQGLPGNPSEYWRLFRQLLEAVSYIHREGFIHRDLKPMNIFIDRSNNIKVGDFGLAKNSQFLPSVQQINEKVDKATTRNGELSTVVGTVFYTAPEVSSGRYDEKVDMFSLGVIFFEMCYSLSTGMERALILNRLRQQVYPTNWKNSPEKKIVEQLLNPNAEQRPSASELLQSSYLPIEHQDQVIKEALKSLADPASPWQQQVRETLFNQPYSLAKDLLFDSDNKYSEISANDYLLFNKIVDELVKIFHKHGAIENINTNLILPKIPNLQKNQVYEVLDRSGQVLTLPYDLIIPVARFISKNEVNISKFYRHEFVYRPNLKGMGMPDTYSAMNFNIISTSDNDIITNDAECIKIADEVLHMIPNLPVKKIILINNYDILNAVISFAFKNVPIDDQKRIEVFQVLSQLGIDKTNDEIKKILKEDFQIPRIAVEELIGNFRFTCSIHEARHKLQKLMIDSPHLIKVEKSFAYLIKVLDILKQFQIQSEVLFNPLINYDNQYYRHGLMFQAVIKSEKSKRFNRIITGGRFDSLINSFKDISITTTNSTNLHKQYNGVGFTLTTSFLFTLMKNIISRKIPSKFEISKWKGNRCDVIVSSTQQDNIDICGYEILGRLWSKNISSDILNANTQDEIINQAYLDGAKYVVLIRQSQQLVSSKRHSSKKSSIFKPLKIKCLTSGKDVDLDNYDELISFLSSDLGEDTAPTNPEYEEEETEVDFENDKPEVELTTIDLNQKITVVNNDAPRGRKNNKREKWEIENNAKIIGGKAIQTLAQGPVLIFDLRDEVLDMISITSIHQQDEWIRKVVFSSNNLPKSFAMNILNCLVKESLKGHKWCILVSSRTQYTTIVDLRR